MIVVIDCGMGNLNSVAKAMRRIGVNVVISSNKDKIASAKKLILPGIGHFGTGMEHLKKSKILDVLNKRVIKDRTPILGICLGMQLFTDWGEEGDAKGLGYLKGKTIRFAFSKEKANLKIPHMGWNSTDAKKDSPLLRKIPKDATFYFVHSYYVVCEDKEDILATTNYGFPFTSMVQKGSIYGTQFHPEKSHENGLALLKNFIENT